MNAVSIVTLTGFADIFAQFRAATGAHEPDVRKIVVTSRGIQVAAPGWAVLAGAEPFVFARNANMGLRVAAPDDVLLVNDDVTFLRPGSVKALQRIAHEHPEVGILSPQFLGQVGNRLQSRKRMLSRLTYSNERVPFTCVYVRREVLDRVGDLDERFAGGYGSEDDDYCLRVQRAGFLLAVTPEVVVRHGYGSDNASASFRRVMDVDTGAVEMHRLFREKWSLA